MRYRFDLAGQGEGEREVEGVDASEVEVELLELLDERLDDAVDMALCGTNTTGLVQLQGTGS